ncbi:MAG: phenylalanine--tRNA ligase subunit beta [bacterium]|nr:phenylalanine--tRNA ligase subunit beta [bacterium]
MRVALSWLNEFVDLQDQTVQSVSDLLTFSGVEVEAIESTGTILDEHFVVGEVLTCEAHPDSDHLHVCKVSDGKETLQIVCGAPNVRAGLKTPLAKIGAVMPGPEGFKIKKGKLRGVESFGMLCSRDELGLGGAHDGIWELPAEAVTGTLMQPFMPEADTVYDLEITWNRPDCLSVVGIARELAALLNRELKLPSVDFEEKGPDVHSQAKVIVEDSVLCPRYTARVLHHLDPKAPTPDWMARRLEQCGMRSLGLAVDVTNYVMLEVGQPLHAFDHTTLSDATIVVRRAKDGETMRTLDGIDRALDSSMLMIADAHRATAVAGIMGGEETEVAEGATGTILLESALFDAASVKFTATKLGIASESSYRFARGVDKDLADFASRRAVSLLVKYGGAEACTGVIDVDARDKTPIDVKLSYQRVNDVIGVTIPAAKVDAILTSLGIEKVAGDETSGTFRAPSWRYDISLPADLIEEVTRMNGLDAIPTQLPTLAAVSQLPEESFRTKKAVRHALLALGFTEAMHYSFLSKAELDGFDPMVTNRLVIPNPVSADYGVLRDSLLPQMMGSLGRNAARQTECCALFEIGRVFSVDAKTGKPVEADRVAFGLMGPFGRDALSRRAPLRDEEAMLWLKGAVEALCERLHAPRFGFFPCKHPAFAKGFAAEICLGRKRVGLMGAASADIRHRYRLNTPMVVVELEMDALTKGMDALPRLKPVPQFPASRKDIAFIAPETLTHETIVRTIKKHAPAELTDVALFDIFTSKQMGAGKRSMGYTLEFRSAERTLKDAEVNAAFAKIVAALHDELGVEIREA